MPRDTTRIKNLAVALAAKYDPKSTNPDFATLIQIATQQDARTGRRDPSVRKPKKAPNRAAKKANRSR